MGEFDDSIGGYKLLSLSGSQLQAKSDEFLKHFEHATTDHDLNSLLASIDEINGSINSEISHYIKHNQRKHDNEIVAIELQRAKLSQTLTASDELIKLFSNSNDLGNSLTYQLKALDKEISKVDETIEHVSLTKLLKNNIDQAVYALEHNNFELAANCVHTIKSKVPKALIEGKYASHVIPSTEIPELPTVMIEKLTKQLLEIFKIKFDEAANNKDIPQLSKFFQLFPLIGQEEAGLLCYSRFICQIITDTLRNLMQFTTSSIDKSKRTGLYSRSSMQLFENISMMLSQHAPLIKRHYSSTYPDAISYVITKIQHEIDSQIGLITDTYYDENRINKVLQDIGLYKFPILNSRTDPDYHNDSETRKSFEDSELVTLVQSGDLFSEFASILNYWSLYCKFITTRYFNESTNKVPQLLVDSNFTKKVHSKYLPAFENILNFYFRRSLEKAITIEEIPQLEPYLMSTNNGKVPDQPPCSSVIEDFTMVLNTCIRGVLDSSQLEALKSFVTESMKVIQTDLINGYLVKELNDNLPRYNSSLSLLNPKMNLLSGTASPRTSRSATPQPEQLTSMGFFKGAQSAIGNVVGTTNSLTASNTITNNPKLLNFVIYMNTVAVGQEYLVRILNNFTKNDSYYLKNNFPFGDEYHIVSNVLKQEMLDPFVSLTNKIIQESLVNFYNQVIKTKLLIIISDFLSESEESNYLMYSANALNDNSSILKFSNEWRSLITPYRQVFHHDLIYSKLIRLIVLNLANIIEKRLLFVIKKFKVNELGALKLEKDISSFISEVCEDNYELREKFLRVTQIILLVGMDDEEYEQSIIDEDTTGMNWILTPAERKQFRGLRV